MGAFFLVLIMAASQPEEYRLAVRVTESSGFELPGVTVVLRRAGVSVTRVTDVSGTAIFENLPAAAYEVEAELAGFKTKRKEVALSSNVELPVKLKLDDSNMIVHGCGMRTPDPGVTVFTRHILELLPLQ